jgi:hypothetical protein
MCRTGPCRYSTPQFNDSDRATENDGHQCGPEG